MSNSAVRFGIVGLVAIALTACGRSDEKKNEEATPRPVATAPAAASDVAAAPAAISEDMQKRKGDAAVALRRLARQKSATDAARCGIVFATAVDLALRSGDSKGSARMSKASQATLYVMDVAVADRGESPLLIKKTQATTTEEAQSWSQQQFETFIGGCTKEFSDLAPLMSQAGLLK